MKKNIRLVCFLMIFAFAFFYSSCGLFGDPEDFRPKKEGGNGGGPGDGFGVRIMAATNWTASANRSVVTSSPSPTRSVGSERSMVGYDVGNAKAVVIGELSKSTGKVVRKAKTQK